MTNLKSVLKLNILLFSLILLVHLYRAIFYFPAQIYGWEVPRWINLIFAVIASIFVAINYKALKEL